MQKQVVGNWKMNVPPAGVAAFLNEIGQISFTRDTAMAVAPPFPYIAPLAEEVTSRKLALEIGAQNCSDKASGAYTGEVSADMVAAAGGRFVVVGHSERRSLYGETDDLVGRKLEAVCAAGLRGILCIGESLEVREKGDIEPYLVGQIKAALEQRREIGDLTIAYEPIWAIGTGRNASGATVAAAARLIRHALRETLGRDVPLLYGGSVTDENVEELIGEGEIDGFLVGGASLEAKKFRRIYDVTARHLSASHQPGG